MTDLLEQLIREQAPAPRSEFATSLDRRVEHGFGSSARVAAERDPIWPWEPALLRALGALRRPAVAIAVLTTVAIVGGGILTAMPNKQSSSTPGWVRADKQGGADSAASTELRPSDYEAAPIAPDGDYVGDAKEDAGGGSSATAVTATITDYRRHILGTGLFLAVEPAAVPEVVADSVEVARDLGGYPGSSSYDVDGATATGSADVWVPTDRVADAMARLSRLGDVERTTSESRDVTASRAGLANQIRDDQARLRDLERADRNDPYSRQAREAIANQLELRRQRLADLDRRIDMSLINVKVRGVEPEPAAPPERWTIDWALDMAGEVAGRTVALVIVLGGALLLPALAAGAVWFALCVRRRRDRERVLDDE